MDFAEMPDEALALLLLDSPEHAEAIARVLEDRKEAKLAKLKGLCTSLEAKRDACVRAKADIERRWAEDIRQREGYSRGVKGDRTAVSPLDIALPQKLNMTASRCQIWAARVTNMVVPGSSGQPWHMTPTPSPDLYSGETDPQEAKAIAEIAAGGMRDEIKDQLHECHFAKEVRRASDDLVTFGTGILCGPENYRKKRTRFKKASDGQRSLMVGTVDIKPRPRYRRVDPRYFYPEMVDCIGKARYGFELMLMTSAELKELSQNEGFTEYRDQFAKLLETKPDLGAWSLNVNNWNNTAPYKDAIDDRYAVWKFVGFLSKEQSEILGCECLPDYDEDMQEIDRQEQMLEVYFCQGYILNASPYVLDGTDRLPYYVANFFKLDDTMFGGSLPWRARDAQESINGLHQALQLNVSASASSIIGIKKGAAQSADGDDRHLGPKVYYITDEEVDDIRKVFSSTVIDNNAAQILEVLLFRLKMFDEEINLPLIAQGQPSEAVPTSSGLAMLMNAANVAQRDIAQECEDEWLTPVIESAYAWNMLHNPREDIKGDFDCVVSLVSDNVFKDIRAQRLMLLNSMRMNDPALAARIKDDVLFNQLSQALEVDADLFRTDAEVRQIQEQNPPPPDPAMLKLELEKSKIEAEAQFRTVDRQMDYEERMRELDIREREAEAREFVAIKNLEIRVAEVAATEDKTIAQMQAELGIEDQRQRTKRAEIGAKAGIEAQKIAARERETALEVRVESPPTGDGARLA